MEITEEQYARIKDSLPVQRGNVSSSVVTLKPAICGHFKTGHRDWPKT